MNEDIRDLHGPLVDAATTPWWHIALIALGAFAVCALAASFVVWRRRRALSPEAIALRELERSQALIPTGDAHALAERVSSTVRDYVEAAFDVHAPRRTTEELLTDLLRASSPVAPYRASLGGFLELCDLAKYARYSLSTAQMGDIVASAQSFVRSTSTPQPVHGDAT